MHVFGFLFVALSFLLLTACVPAPVDDGKNAKGAPVVFPKPMARQAKDKPHSAKKVPSAHAPYLEGSADSTLDSDRLLTVTTDFANGWSLVDRQGIVSNAVYSAQQGGFLLTLNKDAGLGVLSAEDVQKKPYYRGMVNGAHLIAVPSADVDKVLVTASNRKNARFSILLQRQ
jgi:hypothetical protein